MADRDGSSTPLSVECEAGPHNHCTGCGCPCHDGSTTSISTTEEHIMDLTDIAVDGRLWTNEMAPVNTAEDPMEGEDAVIEVDLSDENEIAVHMRHYADESACLSFYTTRAGALALSEVLRAAAGKKL